MKPTMLLLALGALTLNACATMGKDECRTVDWRTVGFEDGVAGRPGDRIGEYRRACADHGVTPDLNGYLAGRTLGLREYCQPQNGYRAGVNGDTYYNTCPADLAPAFEQAYDSGRELYVRIRRVTDVEDGIAARHREIRRLEDSATRHAFEVVSDSATPEERAQAVIDTKQAAERIGRLKAEIEALEADRERYSRELESYRSTVAAAY